MENIPPEKPKITPEQIKKNLDELISNEETIIRKNILDAETISYNKIPSSKKIYDEFGFIETLDDNNSQNEMKKCKYLIILYS